MIGRESKRALRHHHRPVRFVHLLLLQMVDAFGRHGEGLVAR